MTNPEILKILRCPVTQSSLEIADDQTVETINAAIQAGTQVDRIGNVVSEKIESGLVNEDRSLLLPVRGEIAVLVADQAIKL
jgi:uncharacterized protein YbaR (Trm112 family)